MPTVTTATLSWPTSTLPPLPPGRGPSMFPSTPAMTPTAEDPQAACNTSTNPLARSPALAMTGAHRPLQTQVGVKQQINDYIVAYDFIEF